jgi:hypothetical protein
MQDSARQVGVAQPVCGALHGIEMFWAKTGVLQEARALGTRSRGVANLGGDLRQLGADRARRVALDTSEARLEEPAEIVPSPGLGVELTERPESIRITFVVRQSDTVGLDGRARVDQVAPLDDPDAMQKLSPAWRARPLQSGSIQRDALAGASLIAEKVIDS